VDLSWKCRFTWQISVMYRVHKPTSRIFVLCIVSLFLQACAFIPDNWAFSEEIMNTEALAKVNRVALLDVPEPSYIWLGSPDTATAGFINPLISLAVSTHDGDDITNSAYISITTRNELEKWLEQAGKEVVLLDAKRTKPSKMLKNYDQFSHVNADAILEVAPVNVGYMPEPGFGSKLSPGVLFTYRLVSIKSGEVLIESNVTYSSFSPDLGVVKGVYLIGPEENIFEDEDSVREQPEEAIRRLEIAISEATKAIAKVVTNTYEDPVTESVPFTGNFSGTYIGLTSEGQPRPNSEVIIIQDGNKISGSYGIKGGKIWGDIEGSTISYDWSSRRGANGTGKWLFIMESGEVTGTWVNRTTGKSGTWNLRKIE
jgi:hypothetical protein